MPGQGTRGPTALRRQRDNDLEAGTWRCGVDQPNRSVVCLCDGLDDRQAQARSARPAVARPGETLEDPVGVVGRDAGSRVVDPQPHVAVMYRRPDADDGTIAGVLTGVLGELEHRLGETLFVRGDGRMPGLLQTPVPIRQRAGSPVDADGELMQVMGSQDEKVGLLGRGE